MKVTMDLTEGDINLLRRASYVLREDALKGVLAAELSVFKGRLRTAMRTARREQRENRREANEP